jgi:flavin-dependent dehydrogenase
MSAPREIEIVGGGLAGLSLGLALQRAGVPVRVYEAGHYPRHRVCGEFIAGLAAPTIAALGLADILAPARRHHAVTWTFGNGPVQRRQELPAPALALSRHRLDAALAAALVAAGGRLHPGTRVTDLAPREGRIVCTGRRRANPGWMGLKFHVRGLPLTADLELHLGHHGYVGLTPVEDDRVNVCGLFVRRKLCAKGPGLLLGYLQASGLTTLAQRLGTTAIDPTSCCAVAGVASDAGLADGSGAVLGDAAGLTPPYTGNGMAMAFQAAESALPCLLAYSRGETTWPEATAAMSRALAGRFNRRLRWAQRLHPWLLQPGRQAWLRRLAPLGLPPLRLLSAQLH